MRGFQNIDFRGTGLDTDSDLRVMAPGDSDERWNCILDVTNDPSQSGNIQNDWGMVLQNYTQPPGVNEVIGSVKDPENKAIIYFVWNSNQFHQIRRWYSVTGVTELILEFNFNFQQNFQIVHANLNGDILTWTDGYQSTTNELVYNSPRSISVSKAIGYTTGQPWPIGYTTIDLQTIEAVRYPPVFAPTATLVSVPNIQSLIVGKYPQFFTQYVYFDSSKSIWSPYTEIVIPQNEGADGNSVYDVDNAIDVTFQTGHFTVTKINIGAKINGAFYLVDTLDKYDSSGSVVIPSASIHTYRYFGDRQLGVLSQSEVLKTQEYLPQVAQCQEVVQGNTLTYTNYIEGFATHETNLTATVKMKEATLNAPIFGMPTYGDLTYRSLSFKRMGIYRLGVIFKRDQGYHCPVSSPDGSQVQIPSMSDPSLISYLNLSDMWILTFNQKPYIEWNITSIPPEWATSYEIVCTKDLRDLEKCIYFTQWGACMGDDEGIFQNDKTTLLIPASAGYSFEQGDRVRLLGEYTQVTQLGTGINLPAPPTFGVGFYPQKTLDTYTNASGIVYDYAIQKFEDGRLFISGEIEGLDPTVLYIWEVYNPTRKTTASLDGGENGEIFYGVGQTFPINNPGTPSRSLSVTTGQIEGIDIYHRWKKTVFKPQTCKFKVDQIAIPPITFPNCSAVLKNVNLITSTIFKNNVSTLTGPVLNNLHETKTSAITKGFKDEKYGTSFNGSWSTFNMFFGSSTAPNAGTISNSTIINILSGNIGAQNGQKMLESAFNAENYVSLGSAIITTLAGNPNGVLNGSDEVTIEFDTINNIDTTSTNPEFNIYLLVEDHSISDYFESNFDSTGKGYVEDDLETRKRYPTNLRHGGQLIQDTQVNNFFSFDAKNYNDQIPTTFGEITRTKYVGYSLVIRQINKSNTMYIGRQEVKSSSGSTLLAVSENIFGSINPAKEGFGSYHPAADQLSSSGTLYYLDANMGKMVRDSLNGQRSISRDDEAEVDPYKMGNFFRNLCQKIRDNNFYSVIGIWDDEIDCYTLTVRDKRRPVEGRPEDSITLVFHEATNRWKSYMNYNPEWYESVGDVTVAFKNGSLWRMYADPNNRNTYFGTHYPQKVAVICNDGYNTRKVFNNIKIDSNVSWDIDLTTPPNATYPSGMKSRLKKENLQNMEGGGFYGSFMKDMNTPGFTNQTLALVNGRELRGEVLRALLTNNETQLTYLRQVIIFYTASEQTT